MAKAARRRASGATLRDLVRAVGRADGGHPDQPLPQAGDRALSGQSRATIPDRFRGVLALTYDKETGEENCIGCRLCEYICPPAGHQGRDAQGGEAELRQDLHARALRVRVLRAVRAGVPDRRHHHDEVVRHGDRATGASCCSTRTGCTRSGSSSSRRGRPATGCATCRRRPRRPRRTRRAREAGRRRPRRKPEARPSEPRADRVLGPGGRAARLGPRRRADQEPLPLGALPGARADRHRGRLPARSTPSSSPPSSSCSTRAASSPSWSSPSW